MEKQAFKALLIQAHDYCLPKLMKSGALKVDAEDAFMEAMHTFWEDEQSGKVKYFKNLPALIYVMARNIWLMQKRKAKRGQFQEYATDPASFKIIEGKTLGFQEEESYDGLIQSENEQFEMKARQKREIAFQNAFKQLNDQCKALLTKFVVEKVRLKELQTSLGFPSANAVKMAKYRCKQNLVKYFKIEVSGLEGK